MKRYATVASFAAAMAFVATASAQNTPSSGGTQTPSTGTTQPGGTTSSGGTRPSGASAQGQQSASGDRQFVEQMLMTNMAEIQLGQLAQQKASSAEVKTYAQQMITDHTKANQELQPIAQQLGIQIPSQLDAKHRAVSDKLAKLQGAEFDREYAKAMVDGHRDALQIAQQAAGNGTSSRNGSAVGTSGSSSPSSAGTTGSGAGTASSTGGAGSASAGGSAAGSGMMPRTSTEFAAKTAPVIQQHLQHAETLQRSTK